MNTTSEQILDIDDALVSDENPARDDDVLDYERCARLHNYLVAYGWMARHKRDTPNLDALARERWFFRQPAEDIDAIRERLDAPLNSFLDLIFDPEPPFFYWVNGLEMRLCDESFPCEDNDLEDEGKERFVVIYGTVLELGSHCLGVLFDQQLNRASFPMTLENSESVEPVDEHQDMWFPLETILTHWIYMIRLGKVVPGLPECNSTSRSQIGLWSWLPYCNAQVDSTIAAMERYSATVESRIPHDSLLPISAPLFTDSELDMASVPKDCFIRKFLTRVKTPRFNFIAPGLRVPHDKEEFARLQKFTTLPNKDDCVPAVLLFPTPDRTVDLNLKMKYLFSQASENADLSEGDPIPTGLYSEPLTRNYHDTEEAGFRLLLPFPLRPDLRDTEGARMSDGRLVTSGSSAELFQHGWFHPFGGERRSQRLERLFKRWTELIEGGVWTVGEYGVEGGVDKFRDADNGNGAWRDYWIPPGW